jgi:transcriptional regulator GlxA family with amidase domain
MKIAFILFNDINWLDMAGVYEPLLMMKRYDYAPDFEWEFCGMTETVTDEGGLTIKPGKLAASLQDYDALIVPGGKGTRALQHDAHFITWLQSAKPSSLKISVCTGSLILGAAGFLNGKTATTHFKSYEELKPYCGTVSHERIVEDGTVITAGAVAASIDLGLFLVRKWAGDDADVYIRHVMDYRG